MARAHALRFTRFVYEAAIFMIAGPGNQEIAEFAKGNRRSITHGAGGRRAAGEDVARASRYDVG